MKSFTTTLNFDPNDINQMMVCHYYMWGVPCGPTLEMVIAHQMETLGLIVEPYQMRILVNQLRYYKKDRVKST